MTKDYYNSRKAFTPETGGVYENESGGIFRCLRIDTYRQTAVMRNERSGWTFKAHGVGIYKDGRIDWDYSTDGYFSEAQA